MVLEELVNGEGGAGREGARSEAEIGQAGSDVFVMLLGDLNGHVGGECRRI